LLNRLICQHPHCLNATPSFVHPPSAHILGSLCSALLCAAELVELERALAKHTTDVVRAPFALTGDTRFYRSAASAADANSVSFFRVKPIMFDLYLSLALTVYFATFFVLVKEARSVAEVSKLFGFK
jgi:hypothetical protein